MRLEFPLEYDEITCVYIAIFFETEGRAANNTGTRQRQRATAATPTSSLFAHYLRVWLRSRSEPWFRGVEAVEATSRLASRLASRLVAAFARLIQNDKCVSRLQQTWRRPTWAKI